jgi:hypothetical protein
MCGPSESAKHDQQAAYVRCSRGLRAAWRDQQGLAAAEKALLALVALAMILMVGRIILSGSRVASDRSVAMLTESSAAPAISWNDSGRPSGDATMSSGSSGSRGGGFLDGLGGAISDGWGAIQEAGRQVGGFVYGVGTGAVEMVKGTAELVWSVGKMTVGELIDPAAAQAERDKWGQVISAVVEDPGKVWDAITEPIVESWKRGDYGEAIGRGFFEAASTVVGPKGLNKIGTIGRVSSKADDVARIGNALEDVAKTGNKLDDAGRVGNKLDDAADASRVSSTGPRKVCEGPSCLCFSSDTPVMTASGPQPISELRPGDLVLSKDEQTGETALRSIVSVFVTPERPLMALTIQTESGQTETLRLTDSHPMYAKGKGFVAARELLSGDELVNSAGAPLIVVGSESLFERDTVYNLEVEGFHTYFAGRQGVWAHNMCGEQSPENVPPAPAIPSAAAKAEAAAKEASDILTERSRKHIFEGETRAEQGDSVGWHLESSGDKEKGTYILEGTRSPTDEHGVYEGNVMIEGLKKKARSTFFPKDWTKEQVETAIREAYESRKPEVRSGSYRGETSTGMKVELRLVGKGTIQSAYPVYQGSKYQGPKK